MEGMQISYMSEKKKLLFIFCLPKMNEIAFVSPRIFAESSTLFSCNNNPFTVNFLLNYHTTVDAVFKLIVQ